VFSGDVDAELRRLANKADFRHRDAAQHAQRFRASGDVAHLVEILDDPHPCAMVDVVTIEESLANLMLLTPGCTAADRAVARAALARAQRGNGKVPWWRRWWRHS
jgi:hypothetical protein